MVAEQHPVASSDVAAAGRSAVLSESDLQLPRPPGLLRLFFARHMWIVDGAVVAVYLLPAAISIPLRLTGATGRPPSVIGGILAIAGTVTVAVALVARRRHPRVLVAAVALSLFLVIPDFSGLGQSAPLFALYAVAVYSSVRAAWVSLGVLAVCLAVVSLIAHNGDLGEAVAMSLVAGFLMLVAMLVGINVGNRKRYLEALLDRAAQLARERDQQALLAAVTERARIAREMHDIVAHSLTVMVALADGADLTVDRNPERARDAMRRVAETGRTALADMRVVLGVLAEPGWAASGTSVAGTAVAGTAAAATRAGVRETVPAPQPGHAELGALIQSYRSAGMIVHFTVSGAPPRDTGLQLTVFRVVQEALTNSLRYAPEPKHVVVTVGYGAEQIVVSVADEGQSQGGATSLGSGQGIIGMRERVAAYGGRLEAGATTAGGWRVRATLPPRQESDTT
ncbi:sensor histidine kinase [soil metagenome]